MDFFFFFTGERVNGLKIAPLFYIVCPLKNKQTNRTLLLNYIPYFTFKPLSHNQRCRV